MVASEPTSSSFHLDTLVSSQDPGVPSWNLIISAIKGLGDDLDYRSTPSFQDGQTEAQKGETSHTTERGVFNWLLLFLLMPKVFAL